MAANEFGNDIEKAVKFISAQFAGSKRTDKSVLVHSFRVGMRLYEAGYPLRTVLAGFLHDVLEEGYATRDDIAKLFGSEVADLVAANTKDELIDDDRLRRDDALQRAVLHGEAAAVVKAADLLDNRAYFAKHGRHDRVERFETSMRTLVRLLPPEYQDEIFTTLRKSIVTE